MGLALLLLNDLEVVFISKVSPLLSKAVTVLSLALFSLTVLALFSGLGHGVFGSRSQTSEVIVLARVGNLSKVSASTESLFLGRGKNGLRSRLTLFAGSLIARFGGAGYEIVGRALVLGGGRTLAVLHLADGANVREVVFGSNNATLALVGEHGLASELHVALATLRLDGNAAGKASFMGFFSLVVECAPSLAYAISFFLLAAFLSLDLLSVFDGGLVVSKGEVGLLFVG